VEGANILTENSAGEEELLNSYPTVFLTVQHYVHLAWFWPPRFRECKPTLAACRNCSTPLIEYELLNTETYINLYATSAVVGNRHIDFVGSVYRY
jgi:hypothetical protein